MSRVEDNDSTSVISSSRSEEHGHFGGLDGPTNASAGPPRPRLRANKACENCRLRKIRCSGGTPCGPCAKTDLSASCYVRVKARPNRPIATKITQRDLRELSHLGHDGPVGAEAPSSSLRESLPSFFSQAPDTFSEHMPIAINLRPRRPLDQLQDLIADWSSKNGLPTSSLVFFDESRLARLPATVLPEGAARVEFEDQLIRSLVSAEDFDHLECLDGPRLLNLYHRYRALPNTLSEDQLALLLASLCVARYTQLRRGVAGGLADPTSSAREDVTYYRMARQALAAWRKPSITSMWALFCMVTFVQLNGGLEEYRDITSMWAWQVSELGLHKQATAQLYTSQDMSETMLASYCYSETAIMTDLTPAIPLADVELRLEDCPSGISHYMLSASNHAVKYLRDYADMTVEVASMAYMHAAEEVWSEDLAFLRDQNTTGMARIKQGWAEMRLHWLRILLYIPHLYGSPSISSQAIVYLTRSLVNIINIHTEASLCGKLDPSWPQLVRIVTCGQLLVLSCARGEMHTLEATTTFERLIALLQAHVAFWSTAKDLVIGFSQAASRLGVLVPPVPNYSEGGPADATLDIDWSGMFLDLDMNTFVDFSDVGVERQ